MKIIIHRGTHQIGGCATEISTDATRLIIDMGSELNCDPNYIPKPLDIPGVTDSHGKIDAILLTHGHPDHNGQLYQLFDQNVPVYMGELTRMLQERITLHMSNCFRADNKNAQLLKLTQGARTFSTRQCETFQIGNISITPIQSDHSAQDSCMFLIEAEGLRILHTGDFRSHGHTGAQSMDLLKSRVGHVDIVITEATSLKTEVPADAPLSAAPYAQTVTLPYPSSEMELGQTAAKVYQQYRYTYVLAPSSNIERIFAFYRAAVQAQKAIICDQYQLDLLNLIANYHADDDDSFWKLPVLPMRLEDIIDDDEKIKELADRGFVMFVRNNKTYARLIQKFDRAGSILLYSMWDGYRTCVSEKDAQRLQNFINLAENWSQLHVSGHATPEGIRHLLDITTPDNVIPIHTESPEVLAGIYPEEKVRVLEDREVFEPVSLTTH